MEVKVEDIPKLAVQTEGKCTAHVHTAWGLVIECDKPRHSVEENHGGWMRMEWADNPHTHGDGN